MDSNEIKLHMVTIKEEYSADCETEESLIVPNVIKDKNELTEAPIKQELGSDDSDTDDVKMNYGKFLEVTLSTTNEESEVTERGVKQEGNSGSSVIPENELQNKYENQLVEINSQNQQKVDFDPTGHMEILQQPNGRYVHVHKFMRDDVPDVSRTRKSGAQRMREFRQRQRERRKRELGDQVPKIRKSGAQRMREFRQRQKERQLRELGDIQLLKVRKSGAQRMREFRQRQKERQILEALYNVSNPSTDLECETEEHAYLENIADPSSEDIDECNELPVKKRSGYDSVGNIAGPSECKESPAEESPQYEHCLGSVGGPSQDTLSVNEHCSVRDIADPSVQPTEDIDACGELPAEDRQCFSSVGNMTVNMDVSVSPEQTTSSNQSSCLIKTCHESCTCACHAGENPHACDVCRGPKDLTRNEEMLRKRNCQYVREYRKRKKEASGIQNVPRTRKSGAQRMREFRQRQKERQILESLYNNTTPSIDLQREKERLRKRVYRQRLKNNTDPSTHPSQCFGSLQDIAGPSAQPSDMSTTPVKQELKTEAGDCCIADADPLAILPDAVQKESEHIFIKEEPVGESEDENEEADMEND